ncbi:enoyl-CoA hydratase-related protein [Pseudidiomarina taiwanensis]|uniref:Gamma-carboxygeranoyl-CoA hydratase n=1 Tax=Pseudidiomarina taiwanensis TaxID=337250 RepID=A0A432ZNS8_9GAMM|nr:enoyl-CoA hydratase-related protein [Pseudidiomarina taiwanensis]RUO79518.1 gamma-carboxygeranoyl-CoA hydratase [Pseudidiomarina taiwanensis]
MNYQHIDLDIKAATAYLTMQRPEVHNAFDDQMIAELIDALETVDNNPSLRVLVLRAEGRNFSAGADLNWMRSMASKNFDENIEDAGQLSALMERLDQLSKPTIAVVQGAAFGGAVGLAACCDIVLAAPTSKFCLSEVKIGLIPAVISPYVMRALGVRQSRRFMLTAEVISAEQALQFGLVHEVTDALEQRLAELVQQLLNNSPAAVTAAKRLVLDLEQRPLDPECRQITIERIAAIRVSAEGQEGLNAFLEKRSPAWQHTPSEESE